MNKGLIRVQVQSFLLGTVLLIAACTGTSEKFPEVQKISQVSHSVFLPTLEHTMHTHQNSIYSATLLYAWDEIRKRVGHPITVQDYEHDYDLHLLHGSESYIHTLEEGEYVAAGEVDEEMVRARAECAISLPFSHKLTSLSDRLIFDSTRVAAFGQIGSGTLDNETIRILYYKDDNHFIISLQPDNPKHEIVLFKTDQVFTTMRDILLHLEKQIQLGEKEKQTFTKAWRYVLRDEDEVLIPKIACNLEHNYPELEGHRFTAGAANYLIETAYQRTAFVLNESGAVLESEAFMEAATEELEESEPQPKRMHLDKPFFIMLKRQDSTFPYFAMWILNAGLMQDESAGTR